MRCENQSKIVADNMIDWMRQYASQHVNSYLADTQGCFPPHIFLDLGNQGFFGMHVTRHYQGLELTTYDMLRVIEQIAATDLALVTILIESVQGGHTLEQYASPMMKDQYLSSLATGRIFMSGAMTESAAGSNPRAMQSLATPYQESSWLINGSKRWVGMGSWAELIAVYVQQYDRDNNWLGMSGFLVPRGTPGLDIGPAYATMGLRGFSKHAIYMNNIQVFPEHLLGQIGEGMEIAQDNMMYIRLCLAAASVGAMKRCVQLMYRYADRRVIATGQLIDNPVTLVRLSEMTAVIDTIENLVYLTAHFLDTNPTIVPEEALVISKILGSEHLGITTDLLVQTLGARGYEEASGISQLFRDARAFRVFEGPTEALNMYVGSRALEKNTKLEHFISDTLNQKKLFEDIKRHINAVDEYCSSSKNNLFVKPFSINYWLQTLVGEIISYGLLLACIEYSLETKQSDKLQRASLWARNKYNEIVEKALNFSLGEKVLIQSNQLSAIVASYTHSIGDIEKIKQCEDISTDKLLTRHEENKADYSTTANFSSKASAYNPSLEQCINENNLSTAYIHQLFEEQVARTPEAIALAFQDEKITYKELNNRSNRLAHCLKHEELGPNKIIGLYIERSIEMIVGLLGILKAGAAYLPLDFNYPSKRLQFMFEDSGTQVLLSSRKLSNNLPFCAKKVIFLDELTTEISTELDQNHQNNLSLNDLGYVIYTSGSTGQPKGVMLPHKALTNLIEWQKKRIPEKRNVLQFTALSFDMSFLEIFSALSSGGLLKLISEEDRLDQWRFSHLLKKHNIEQLVLSIPFLKKLVEAKIEPSYFENLKEIIIAGEQLIVTPSILSFFNGLKSCRLLNYYGPSETHVVTAYEFPQNVADWPDYPPIGQVISNTKILILDENKQRVPVGKTGEIYIGGVCLATGYINSAALTAERFIPDPWDCNAQLYRTGDLGKYLPNGNLVFLGRRDEQVKIRGFRVELKEIEFHLTKCPGIKEAAVIVNKDAFMDTLLEAFLVIEGKETDSFINQIHSFLKERLPTHMIPSILNVVEQMPLTSSGKIDRLELQKTTDATICSTNKIMAPKTEAEKEIVKIMERVFKTRIGTNHSFSSIGGNSLLAMHIVSNLRDKFSIELPAHSILSDPTIAHTAKRIDHLLLEKTPEHSY